MNILNTEAWNNLAISNIHILRSKLWVHDPSLYICCPCL